LESISATELARQVIDTCLAERTWPQRALDVLLERALGDDQRLAAEASRAFFSIVIERLADLFEPALVDVYVSLFSHVIHRTLPEFEASALIHRYHRISHVGRYRGSDVDRVYVLSRITLGADIAVTSVCLDAMKRRFPDAEICFVGPSKNSELFLDDPRILPISVNYGRSALLLDRIIAAKELEDILDDSASIVIDPDSRLTQLGLVPVCDDARYFFFESRAYGGDSSASLPVLADQWLNETFGLGGQPYLAPELDDQEAEITVSLGVGENEEKRISDEFEEGVLRQLLGFGRTILIDRGAGGEETERVDTLVKRLAAPNLVKAHTGPFSSFARQIIGSRFYFGYDSAGQHAAAAAGVHMVSVFAGFASERMFERWKPTGPRMESSRVLSIGEAERGSALEQSQRAIAEVAAAAGLG
jgi:ADP-heptose:LPS heptosyltransferase